MEERGAQSSSTHTIYSLHIHNPLTKYSKVLVILFLRATSELQKDSRDNADTDNESAAHTSTTRKSNILKKLREPEGADETPDLADKGDEDTDTGSFFLVAINGVGDEHCGDDLVADGGDGGTDERSDVPFVAGVLGLDQEDDEADHAEDEAGVAEPETVFGLGTVAGGKLAGAAFHPCV